MLDDLVFAVLILLGLSVPFAFALERVLVGATTIYRQIYWCVIFFAATFLILYLSHPAFAIANTPIIIFLGFAIVVMSVMVIFIIMRKFEYELKAIQGMTATVHVNDVSNVSTFMAAMQMGISTMRRRPMRTALTAVTIILLTFTILCFASFGTQSGVVTIFAAPNPGYSGAFVHNVNWNPLSEDLQDIIRGRWPELTVCRRLWVSPRSQDNPGLMLSRLDASQPVTVRGILGLETEEIANRPDFQEHFGGLEPDMVLVTEAVAGALGVGPGDDVLLRGRRLRVGRLLDAVQVSAAKDMDMSSILPADFTEATSSSQPTAATLEGDEEEMESMAQRNWASLPVDQVAVVSADTAKAIGGALYGLMVYTADSTTAIETAENLARILPFPIAATREIGVYRHLLGTVLKASGARDLFFPIVLGGLVIFGTMLGSVADRKKEIYTFSALGLAPRHVATLFFAESMVYALIGGLGGYLLAQGTLKLLGLASEYGLVRVPEMNMSSTNTIATILIVMVTVLISSVYPAIKASKSANPGLMRTWRPPAPVGDVMDLVFPFTVSQYDITGVVSFLMEHFGNHSDTGLGRFMTSDVKLAREANGDLGLDARLALAPFDLGVSQTFVLRSTPSEIPGIDEVRVVLHRLSGQPKDWQRLNKVFLDDLRQQFLIWRSIPPETMEHYRQQTLQALNGGWDATPRAAAKT
jgi:ABC-type lipoprotein release transport system permease subunit